jgi:hypothetical protein
MDVNVWGPPAWDFLHSITFTYPENPSTKDKQRYKDFFEQLCYVLPCNDCCVHYQKELIGDSLDKALVSRETLSEWLVDLHNRVNERLGKSTVEYSSVKQKYDSVS